MPATAAPPVAGWLPASAPPITPISSGRTYFAVFGDVVGCTTFGGAACALLSLGFLSILIAPVTVIVGSIAGLALGIVVGPVVAAVVVRKANQPMDPSTLVAGLETTGVVLALAVVAPMHAALWLSLVSTHLEPAQVVLFVLNSVLALLGVGYIGFHWGRAVTARHLRRYGLEAPETLPIWPTPTPIRKPKPAPGVSERDARPGRRTSR